MKLSFLLELLLIVIFIHFLSEARIITKEPKRLAKRPITPTRQTLVTAPELSSGSSEDINELVVVAPALDDDVSSPAISSSSVEQDTSAQVDTAASAETVSTTTVTNTDDTSPINRFCKCTNFECNCCREFRIPIAGIGSKGCAKIQYLDNERMSVGVSFGERLVASRVISSRKPTPICMPLPGGFSRFCGRIYGISRRSNDFQACLGLELRADDEVEAALRVSCFKFGERGLTMTEAQPLPPDENDSDEDDDDDDDETGGLFSGLLGDDDDDEDDEVEADATEDSDDYTGFSFLDSAFGTTKKPARQTAVNTTVANVVVTANKKPKTKKKDEDEEDGVFDIIDSIIGDDDDDDEEDDDDEDDEENEIDKEDESQTDTGATEDNEKEEEEAEAEENNLEEDEEDDDAEIEESSPALKKQSKTSDAAIKKKVPKKKEDNSIFSRLLRYLVKRQ